MQPKLLSIILAGLLLVTACKKKNETPAEPVDTTTKVLAVDLNFPWEIIWGPDNFIWMTERAGRISRVNPANGTVTPLLVISEVSAKGEGGMLGMALHPNFNTTPQVFVAYNYDDGPAYKEKIVRFTYNGTTLVNPVTILDNIAAANIHNGCRLIITPDLKLLISTGDAANTNLPQNTGSVNGKILRLNLDGSIPADNPIANNPVWSYGHRNAQGLVYANNRLYSSEHGPNTDDEINIIEKGRNYGWPAVRGLCDESGESNFCGVNNVREPLKAWTPTIATCGLDYYDKDLIPQWKGSLLLCTLKGARLVQLSLNNNRDAITGETAFFQGSFGRLRDLCISPQGKVYVCTSNGNDRIIEIDKK